MTGRLGGVSGNTFMFSVLKLFIMVCLIRKKKKKRTFSFSKSYLRIWEEGWSEQLPQASRAPWRPEGIPGPRGSEGFRRMLTLCAAEGWGELHS